jgi:hypothetical protein
MKRIGPILAVLLGAVVLHSAYRGFTRVEKGKHLKTVGWLPVEAPDVCFYRSYSFTAYEFDISEKGFLEWASRWEVKPITRPFEIRRYSGRLARARDLLSSRPADEDLNAYERRAGEWQSLRCATIANGYCYEDKHSDGGGTWVAYDRSRGRAYYQSMPR